MSVAMNVESFERETTRVADVDVPELGDARVRHLLGEMPQLLGRRVPDHRLRLDRKRFRGPLGRGARRMRAAAVGVGRISVMQSSSSLWVLCC